MPDKPDYRFKFEVTDEKTGDILIADWVTISGADIDQFGGCEAVDHAVARMMRMFRQTAREKHERENYQGAPAKHAPRSPEEALPHNGLHHVRDADPGGEMNTIAILKAAEQKLLAQGREIERLEGALYRIHGELGAALVQRISSDDAIIMDHVEKADGIALQALREKVEIPAQAADRCRLVVNNEDIR